MFLHDHVTYLRPLHPGRIAHEHRPRHRRRGRRRVFHVIERARLLYQPQSQCARNGAGVHHPRGSCWRYSASPSSVSSPITKIVFVTGKTNQGIEIDSAQEVGTSMREIRHWLFLVIILCLPSLPLGATKLSPSGLWKTIDGRSRQGQGPDSDRRD